MAVSYEAIRLYNNLGMGTPKMERHGEAATRTFNMGVPLKLDGSGNMVECDFVGADIVYGVNAEPPHNLAVAATAQDLNEGTPQNQTGVTTPIGAWLRDGKIGLYQANGLNFFSAMLKSGQTYADTLLIAGTLYRLIKDGTSNFWYVDNTLTGGNAGVVNLKGVDPSSPNTATGGARVIFQFDYTKRYFV